MPFGGAVAVRGGNGNDEDSTCHQEICDERGAKGRGTSLWRVVKKVGHQNSGVEGEDIANHAQKRQQWEEEAPQHY